MIRRESSSGSRSGVGETTSLIKNNKQESYNAGGIGNRDAEGYDWDFCVVIKDKSAGTVAEKYAKAAFPVPKMVKDLNDVGLETYSYYTVERSEIIVKIRADVERLSKHATGIKYKMLLDEEELKKAAEAGIPNRVCPVIIPHDPEITDVRPHQFIYCPFPDDKDSHLLSLFAHASGLQHPFSSTIRSKLIMSIIENDADIDLVQAIHDGEIGGFFPLPDANSANSIKDSVCDLTAMPWNLPIEDIRDYLGERIGFLYYFIGHYTTFLVPLSGVSLLVYLVLLISGGLSTGGFITPVYSLGVCIWAQMMIEFWKRNEAIKVMEWGMSDFSSQGEKLLCSFEGEIRPSVVDGKPTRYFPQKEKLFRQFVSMGGLVGAFLLVFVTLLAFFIVRLVFGSTFTYLLQAIFIKVINGVLMTIAIWLTVRENHRTESEFEEYLIAKVFVFEFLNSFSMLFYIAFFRNMVGDSCGPADGSCMGELSLALFVIFGFRVVIINAEELLWPHIEPYFKSAFKSVKLRFIEWYNEEFPDELPETTPTRGLIDGIQASLEKEAEKERIESMKKQMMEAMTKTELEYNKEVYSRHRSTVEEYSELMIQFGYSTLFVAAFPLAPVFALLGNYLKLRILAQNVFGEMRRPVPAGCKGLGTWTDVLQIISLISVVTNCGIICFTMGSTSATSAGSFVMFITLQYLLFACMSAAAYFVPDVPDCVPIQEERTQHLITKIIDAEPDPEPRTYAPALSPQELVVENDEDDSEGGSKSQQWAEEGRSSGAPIMGHKSGKY